MCTNFIVFLQVEKEIIDKYTNVIVFLQVENLIIDTFTNLSFSSGGE